MKVCDFKKKKNPIVTIQVGFDQEKDVSICFDSPVTRLMKNLRIRRITWYPTRGINIGNEIYEKIEMMIIEII